VPLAFQLAAEDSTGQRITLIVISLLLAALALAFLTVWYYRVTDPGPTHRSNPQSGRGGRGGSDRQPSDDPNSPGWKSRLSNFSVPSLPARSPKPPIAPPADARQPAQSESALQDAGVDQSAETVSLEGGFYLDLSEPEDRSKGAEPATNVGSLNSLDLRPPAPLVDPDLERAPEMITSQRSGSAPDAAAKAGTVSFDDWLAEVEATEDQ